MTLTGQSHFMLIFLAQQGEFAHFKQSLLTISAHHTDVYTYHRQSCGGGINNTTEQKGGQWSTVCIFSLYGRLTVGRTKRCTCVSI